VVAHAEDLLADLSLIQKVKRMGLRIFSWGDDNNDKENLVMQNNAGIDGLIYDR
jgi:glycerophosphoryl diester phosphodiesterase